MLIEVNHVKIVVALKPEYQSATAVAFNRLLRDSKLSIVVIAEHTHVPEWSRLSANRIAVLEWSESTVAAVQGNVRNALDAMKTDPHLTVCLCFGPELVHDAILTRCGTVQIGGAITTAGIPDVFIREIASLSDAFTQRDSGYLGEVRCTIGAGLIPFARGGQITNQPGLFRTNLDLEVGLSAKLDVAFLGRYFAARDQRHQKHQFSTRLYRYKLSLPGGSVIESPLGGGLAFLQNERCFDLITRVPSRPGSPDRIGGQILAAADRAIAAKLAPRELRQRIQVQSLSSERDYPTQKGLGFAARARNVRGIFRAQGVEGAKVLLVDDIATSGATLVECTRALLGAGASEVVALAIGLNQNVIPYDQDESLDCDRCDGGRMQIRFPQDNDRAFWGCENYRETQCDYTKKWEEGRVEFNRATRREAIGFIPDIDF